MTERLPESARGLVRQFCHAIPCDCLRPGGQQCETAESKVRAAILDALTSERERALEPLRRIRDCVGGDNPSGGMDAPEDVWEIADTAIRALKSARQADGD